MTENNNQIFGQISSIIESGSLEHLRNFVSQNNLAESINTLTNEDELTPFLLAAECGKTQIYDYLATLPHFNTTQTDKYGLNALSLATLRYHPQMFDHLIYRYDFDRDQTIQREGRLNITPIHYAAKLGHLGMIKHMTENHLYGVPENLISYCHSINQHQIGDYLQHLFDLNQQLEAEISDNNLENFKKLCEQQGAKPKSAQKNLAEHAAINGAIEIFEYLIDHHGFDEKTVDLKFLAAESLFIGDRRLIETIIFKYDFDLEQNFSNGQENFPNLYRYADRTPNNDCQKFLAEVEQANLAFVQAVQDNKIDVISQILSQGKVLKLTLNDVALQLARDGNLEIFKLVASHPKFDKHLHDQNNKSLLHLAATSGNTELVNFLIDDQQLSFDTESKSKILTEVLIKCPENKKSQMVSSLIRSDIGFLFDDKSPDNSSGNIKDYSQILRSQKSAIRTLIEKPQEKLKEIFAVFSLQADQPKSESEIITLFQSLGDFTDNPFSSTKYLFNSSADPLHPYIDFARFVTKNNFRDLYTKIAESSREMRLDHNHNGAAFLIAAFDIGAERKNSRYEDPEIQFLEFANQKFGSINELNRMMVYKDFGNHPIEGTMNFIRFLINSGKIPKIESSTDQIVSCIIPKDEDLIFWKSKKPEVFYSFQTLDKEDGQEFNAAEQRFFNELVRKTQQDIIVPVQQITLSKAELDAVREDRFEKNVFFITKDNINANAVYPSQHKKAGNLQGYKKIIVHPKDIIGPEHKMLHQLAIGVAGLKHPAYYNSAIDSEPNCDYGVTISDSIMSHLCDQNNYSSSCYNLIIYREEKERMPENISFREADVMAITKSLVKQYPELDQRAIEFDNARETCDYKPQINSSQIMMAAVALGALIRYFVNRLSKPSHTINNAVAEKSQRQNLIQMQDNSLH